MTTVQCFWLQPTRIVRRGLRRYASGPGTCPRMPGIKTYHNARVWVDTRPALLDAEDVLHNVYDPGDFANDPRWPTECECGYVFGAGDVTQIFVERLYQRMDTGETMTIPDAPPGAMWDATWLGAPFRGPDGRCLVVKLPPDGHEWLVDGRCSNCTRPNERHFCWVRHGEPPLLTVDKNGETCSAGAGSVQTPRWHGFLREGLLVTA